MKIHLYSGQLGLTVLGETVSGIILTPAGMQIAFIFLIVKKGGEVF